MLAPEVEVRFDAGRLRRERALGIGQHSQLGPGQPNVARVSNLEAAKARCNAVLLSSLQRAICIFHLEHLLTRYFQLGTRGLLPAYRFLLQGIRSTCNKSSESWQRTSGTPLHTFPVEQTATNH